MAAKPSGTIAEESAACVAAPSNSRLEEQEVGTGGVKAGEGAAAEGAAAQAAPPPRQRSVPADLELTMSASTPAHNFGPYIDLMCEYGETMRALVDSGNNNIIIPHKEAVGAENVDGQWTVKSPYTLLKGPVPDAWGYDALVVQGPLAVGTQKVRIPATFFVSLVNRPGNFGIGLSTEAGNYPECKNALTFLGYRYVTIHMESDRESLMFLSNTRIPLVTADEGHWIPLTRGVWNMQLYLKAVRFSYKKRYSYEESNWDIDVDCSKSDGVRPIAKLDTGGGHLGVQIKHDWASGQFKAAHSNADPPAGDKKPDTYLNGVYELELYDGTEGGNTFHVRVDTPPAPTCQAIVHSDSKYDGVNVGGITFANMDMTLDTDMEQGFRVCFWPKSMATAGSNAAGSSNGAGEDIGCAMAPAASDLQEPLVETVSATAPQKKALFCNGFQTCC